MEQIVGTLDGDYVAGVMYVSQLLVAHNKRGLGTGKKLMNEAEKVARKNKLHLMYLKTGLGWKSVKFYEALGFKPVATIKNFYAKKDFCFMTKYLMKYLP